MIFFNSQILFVHNPKTAGTSLLRFFFDAFDEPHHLAGVDELGTYHPSLDEACTYACQVMGTTADQFRHIITCVRNPYAREVSMYQYFRDVLFMSRTVEHDLNDATLLRCVRQAAVMTFADYIGWLFAEFGTVDIWNSKRYFHHADGTKPANRTIWSVETLAGDVADTLASLSRLRAPAPALPVLNVTRSGDWRSYYNKASREIVTECYDWVFAEYGYSLSPELPQEVF